MKTSATRQAIIVFLSFISFSTFAKNCDVYSEQMNASALNADHIETMAIIKSALKEKGYKIVDNKIASFEVSDIALECSKKLWPAIYKRTSDLDVTCSTSMTITDRNTGEKADLQYAYRDLLGGINYHFTTERLNKLREDNFVYKSKVLVLRKAMDNLQACR